MNKPALISKVKSALTTAVSLARSLKSTLLVGQASGAAPPLSIAAQEQQSAGQMQLNQLTDPMKWEVPEWLALHRELETYSVDKHCFNERREFAYRKGWEWTQTIFGLQRLLGISPSAKALGVGAGHEPLLFYFADRVAEVVGTDLYGNETWTQRGGKEADAALLQDPKRFCPRDFRQDRLRLLSMDGTKLDFPDQTFDFVWSLSSIEHFGSHEAARKSIEEMGRVAKLGGIVAIATEVILTPGAPDHPEYFTIPMFERYVVHASPRLLPIQPMSYRLPPLEYLIDPIMLHLDGDVHRVRHHIILNDGKVQFTSGMIFFRRI